MVRGITHFSSAELARVLTHYNIGTISQIRPLVAGNARAPKLVITSDKGTYLLKRRPHGKDDPARVAFAHKVQTLLAKRRFPLAPLVAASNSHTMLHFDNHVYELFDFVVGSRYDGGAESTIDAGRQLASFHTALVNIKPPAAPAQSLFHDSSNVRRHITAIATSKRFGQTAVHAELASSLNRLYENSNRNVSELGFDLWPKQMTHGDWHPGNMLFGEGRVVAVLDFDSMKSSPTVTDVANGMLHFSIVAGRPNPADWPAYLDQAKLVQFLNGYRQGGTVSQEQVKAVLDLMIEALIAEAVLPIAMTGKFANLAGIDFLKMIYRKCQWINKNRKTLSEAIFA
jgi:Ser/Thr protein kinase RdoA (MazF antagonist)